MKTLIIILLLAGFASASDLVKTQMLADAESIAPGESFTIGVKLKMQPEWHVYWVNPGDTGLPTKVTITAPQGFTVGQVQYPVPSKFDVTGGITAYGYQDEVMLLVPVTAPKDLKAGSDVTIGAKTEWLVCNKDQCVKGDATDEVKLKVETAKPQAANQPLFESWRAKVPKETNEVQREVSVDAPGGTFKGATGKLVMTWKQSPEKVEWFPAPPDALMVSSSEVKTENGKSIVTFKVEALAGEKVTNPSIYSVLVYTLNGQRIGVSVPVSLGASVSKGN